MSISPVFSRFAERMEPASTAIDSFRTSPKSAPFLTMRVPELATLFPLAWPETVKLPVLVSSFAAERLLFIVIVPLLSILFPVAELAFSEPRLEISRVAVISPVICTIPSAELVKEVSSAFLPAVREPWFSRFCAFIAPMTFRVPELVISSVAVKSPVILTFASSPILISPVLLTS